MDIESVVFWSFILFYTLCVGMKFSYDRFFRPRTRVIIADDLNQLLPAAPAINHVIMMTNIEHTDNDCPICKEKMEEDIIKTECNHIFHKDCIKSWINCTQNQRYKCPICMQNLST